MAKAAPDNLSRMHQADAASRKPLARAIRGIGHQVTDLGILLLGAAPWLLWSAGARLGAGGKAERRQLASMSRDEFVRRVHTLREPALLDGFFSTADELGWSKD